MTDAIRRVFVLLLASVPAMPAASTLHVRLDAPLTSYKTPLGTLFQATALSPLTLRGKTLIPAGTILRGRVRSSRSVGLGLLRERAMLDLDFFEYRLPDGSKIPFTAQVLEVENAREDVTSDGRIRGILAASGAPALVRGMWLTPSLNVFFRPMAGLAGMTTRMCRAPGPIGSAVVFGLRWILIRFPEPEIHLPAGAELTLAVTSIPEHVPEFLPEEVQAEESAVGVQLAAVPYQVTKPNGKVADDLVNLAFAGTRENLSRAFLAAGWSPADPLTRSTFSRMYKAWVLMEADARAPVSKLLYDGREPDLVFQKSLNTVDKRHHVRIWKVPGEDLWLGAGTHDVGVSFEMRLRMLSHKIDPAIDRERSKIVRDFAAARCLDRVTLVERARLTDVSPDIDTDGHLSLLYLRNCDASGIPVEVAAPRQGFWLRQLARRMALETRQYALRDNAYHWSYRLVRKAHSNLQKKLVRSRRAPRQGA